MTLILLATSGLALIASPASAIDPCPDGNGRVIHGDRGNNILIGTEFDDTIYGGGGNDTIIGLGGHDNLYGGPGDARHPRRLLQRPALGRQRR